jgi:hypothetical protein
MFNRFKNGDAQTLGQNQFSDIFRMRAPWFAMRMRRLFQSSKVYVLPCAGNGPCCVLANARIGRA